MDNADRSSLSSGLNISTFEDLNFFVVHALHVVGRGEIGVAHRVHGIEFDHAFERLRRILKIILQHVNAAEIEMGFRIVRRQLRRLVQSDDGFVLMLVQSVGGAQQFVGVGVFLSADDGFEFLDGVFVVAAVDIKGTQLGEQIQIVGSLVEFFFT